MLSDTERKELLLTLTDDEAAALLYDWHFWARPNQLPPPGKWHTWLVLAGRGYGKTRTGAEWVRAKEEAGYRRIALVAKDAADARDIMIEGESGLLSVCPPWNKPIYQPSKRRIVWPSGAQATVYSGEEPDQLRGPQHDLAWVDELAKFKYAEDTWDNLELGLRLGLDPQCLVSTTPRPTAIIKSLVADPQTVVTKGNSYENYPNLAKSFINRIIKKYEGTRIGRQELYAEILEDNPDALWDRETIEANRVYKAPDLIKIAIGVDPGTSSGPKGKGETGIIVVGVGEDEHGYVLSDVSGKYSPEQWSSRVIGEYYNLEADRIVAEVNNGGDMVESVVRSTDPNVSFKKVFATRGKTTRAEPVCSLYEQGRIHHIGQFPDLEDQMCDWTPGSKSPDRLDALVWAVTYLMLGLKGARKVRVKSVGRRRR